MATIKSIEQKAKAYDKALVIAKSRYSIETEESVRICLELMFPELKDSEDEKIKKEIITYIKWCEDSGYCAKEEMIRWITFLEKQGEQKSAEEIEPTPIFKIGDTLKKEGKDYIFRVDRIQGGYYHCDRDHGAFFPIEEQDNWKLVEQNPAWSEEDERLCQCIIEDQEEALDKISNDKYGHSEIISDLEEMYRERIAFLKSLKERYTWKPSDEQIDALEDAIADAVSSIQKNMLNSLYNDLKKLKG